MTVPTRIVAVDRPAAISDTLTGRVRRTTIWLLCISALTLAGALAGCGSGNEAKPSASGQTGAAGEIREIDSGLHAQLAVQQDVALIAHDKDAYASMERSIRGPGSRGRWRDVDFASHMVVAVLAKPGGGGESISVDRLSEEGGRLVVHATHTVPGRNCAVAAVISHPYAVIEARRVSGEESAPLNTVLRMKTVRRGC